MSNEKQIESIEVSIDQAKELIKRKDTALRLAKNKDFKALILDEYFVNEAARLALLYSDPSLNEKQESMVKNDLLGVGSFKRFLSTVVRIGEGAEQDIRDAEETIDELRAEDEE